MPDRGVSDVVGFVLIVSLIVSTVGVVYVFGIGGLQDVRDAERVDNAERAFDVLADNMADLHKRDAPSRATEIKLAEADLGFSGDTTINVSVDDGGTVAYTRKSVAPIVYSASGRESELYYVNGAVIRTDRNGGVMLSDPTMQFVTQNGERVAVVPIIETRAAGDTGQIGGSTTTLVRTRAVTSGILLSDTGTLDVTINVTSTDVQRAVVWERYLETEIPDAWDTNGDDDVCARSGTAVTCTLEADSVYVPRTGIAVQLAG